MDKGFDYWDFFVAEARRAPAPLYERLAQGVAADPALRDLAAGVRPGQPPGNVLFAAVHLLLLRGAEHPLRSFYPNLSDPVAEGDPFRVFREFVSEHRDELAALIAVSTTNTNEVGRSALLAPAFRALAAQAGEPLHLIEIGPSVGLNQFWDRYGIRYRRGDEILTVDVPGAVLTLDCELRGSVPPLGPAPRVASRVGLERNPVELSDPQARLWLKALVWPDQTARFAQLDRALAALRDAPNIRAGDALDLLPEALAEVPAGEPVCVYHSFVVYQFSAEMREAFDALLILASLRRPVWRLSVEGSLEEGSPLLLCEYRDGSKSKRMLGRGHPHGLWLEWAG